MEDKVHTLEDELKHTKQQYQNDLSKLQSQIQSMPEEINSLKKKKTAHLILSSPSITHDDDSAASDDDMGDSSKQGRKTDATFKGMRLDFEQEFKDLDDQGDEQVEEEEAVELRMLKKQWNHK